MLQSKSILVTGGSGYIGSHTVLELLNANYDVTVIDNLSNSKKTSLDRIEQLTQKQVDFHLIDLLDEKSLRNVFSTKQFDSVIHFAGLKAVGESVSQPLHYYHNNITGTLNLCKIMQEFNVKNMVFSSSATVYGDPERVPITEDFPLHATNPYGQTKLMIEQILQDLYVSDKSWNIILLRYFNPIGAHESGQIGEDPNGIPNNLLPFILKVAIGELQQLQIFGSDYPTQDGTGVRDYIHVVDLALGHIKAVEKLYEHPGVRVYNLGTGKGYSVMEVVEAFQRASGIEIPYTIVDRRPGDIPTCYADANKALNELGWKATRDLDMMCQDGWRWQTQNPKGYSEA